MIGLQMEFTSDMPKTSRMNSGSTIGRGTFDSNTLRKTTDTADTASVSG